MIYTNSTLKPLYENVAEFRDNSSLKTKCFPTQNPQPSRTKLHWQLNELRVVSHLWSDRFDSPQWVGIGDSAVSQQQHWISLQTHRYNTHRRTGKVANRRLPVQGVWSKVNTIRSNHMLQWLIYMLHSVLQQIFCGVKYPMEKLKTTHKNGEEMAGCTRIMSLRATKMWKHPVSITPTTRGQWLGHSEWDRTEVSKRMVQSEQDC